MAQRAKACNLRLTPLYCLQQVGYFFAIAGVGAFAVTYLMDKGFAAGQIGLMLASTNILSCLLQPIIGSYVDRRSMALLPKIILGFLCTAFVCFSSLELLSLPLAVMGPLFIFATLCFGITVPLSNSLCAYYSQNGCHIDYGMGSGIGSLCFSFSSLILGYIIAGLGTRFMMAFCLLFIGLEIVVVTRYPRIDESAQGSASAASVSSLSLPAFCLRYRRFLLTLLGVMCLAACHAMAENYLINVFNRIGGGSENVGIALFLACTTAAPFMIFFEKIQKKTGVVILLRLAGLFYVLKASLLLFAPSIVSVYLIELLQTCTYVFLYPPLYYLVRERIAPTDTAKGQTIASALYTLGTAMGNSLGGTVIDAFSLSAMLFLAAVIAATGTLLINFTIAKADPIN